MTQFASDDQIQAPTPQPVGWRGWLALLVRIWREWRRASGRTQ